MSWLYTILIIVGVLVIYTLINALRLKKAVTSLNEEEFKKGYRKAQLIDVRELKEFEGGHILGARNLPSTQLRNRYRELRTDQPVYLYCQSGTRSSRAALFLKKKGYNQLYQLEGGYKKWNGKIKVK